MINPLLTIEKLGQQIWLDNLSRTLLREGTLQRLVDEDGVSGVTSNPSIFHKALVESPYYQDELAVLKASSLSAEQRYETLVIADIRVACDILHPVFERSVGDAGYVSLEVSPSLAHDGEGTVNAARRLKEAVGRDNLLIKVPATPVGIRAFERLIAEGININVTLMFSLAHEEAVAQAYLRGAKRWVESGGDPKRLKSVASIFLSRVDTLVDQRLEAIGGEALNLRGKSAVAVAKQCYRRYLELFHGPAFSALAAAGVRPQTPLWASTGTKNPAFSDVMYLEPLIGPETVNTAPDATLFAFRDHGKAAPTLDLAMAEADAQVRALAALKIDLDTVGEALQQDGVKLFATAFDKLLALMV
ncbi:MAG: transaldolase [Sulfuricella sp.]|nr:transaldolase [Sulfuricella sp.]